jgi:tRNA 2-thiocytidine biosynthesis protein TtcA
MDKSVNQRKLEKRLRRDTGKAIEDFNMIEHGDRVMVCLSGGKDSFTMLDMLMSLRRSAPVDFELIAVTLDQRQPGFPVNVLDEYLQTLAIPYRILEQDTYSVVKRVVPEGKTMCGLCSRLRRGAIYTFAKQNGISKIALGHHRDDIIETLFLNMFHGARLKAMPPKLLTDDGRHIVIRPLAYCRERDIARYSDLRGHPIIPRNLCGSQSHLQRTAIRQMLQEWESKYPGRIENIFNSLQSVLLSHLLDSDAFDFCGLQSKSAAGSADDHGDIEEVVESGMKHWLVNG